MQGKVLVIVSLFLLGILNLSGQNKRYVVEFYNVENLFDTIRDVNVYDEEFTPEGVKRWTGERYKAKLKRLDEVFFGVASDNAAYPVFIGLCEIENRSVLEDVISQEKMIRVNYGISHHDSPEPRGMDVALLYRADIFKYGGSRPLRTVVPGEPGFRTRDILETWGTIDGEKFCVYVCHWPSRLGGQQASEYKRMAAAQVVRNAVDSLHRAEPDTKVIVMGDLNDDPADKSIAMVLNAKSSAKDLKAGDLFNPFYEMFKAGYGSLAYQDGWNLFDNIIVSENLVNAPDGSVKLYKNNKNKFYGHVYDRPMVRQRSGQFKNYPLRTYVGNGYQGGYSDHFTTYILLAK